MPRTGSGPSAPSTPVPPGPLSGRDRKYRGFFEDAVLGMFQSTKDGRFVDANDALARILGYDSRDELMSSVTDIGRQVHVDPERRAEFGHLLEENGAVQGFEAQACRKDGSVIWLAITARKLEVGPARYEGIVEDISDRKATEEALRSSEERFYKAFHASPAAKSIVSAGDRRFIDVNDHFLAMLGYTRDEVIGRSADDLGMWVDETDKENLRRQVEKSGIARNLEATLRAKDGSLREVLGSAVVIHVDGELCILALLHDITDRKEAEEALRESERRSRELIEALGVAVVMTDEEGHITLCNEAAVDLWGRRPDLGIERWSGAWRMYHLDGKPLPHEEGPTALTLKENRPVRDVEYVIERPDGSRRIVLAHPSPLRDTEGNVRGAVNVLVDITERKRVEASLWDEQQRLNLAMQAGKMGHWEWDIDAGIIQWSETLEAIHGLAPGTFGGTFEDYLSEVHPADRESLLDDISKALKTGTHAADYRIVWPDGSERWVSAEGQVIHDGTGKPIRMIGMAMDITERKRAEEAERFLSDASATLAATTTDLPMTLASIARMAVPWLGDLCALVLVDEKGETRQAAINHVNSRRTKMARLLGDRYPLSPSQPMGVSRVLITGQSEFYPNITDGQMEAAASDPRQLRLLRKLRIKSGMAVPLVARGRTLGTITLAITESGRRYTPADLAVAEDLGRRAGLALDNAVLYSDLQKALEAKDEFLGLMSHELRTPITTIYGGARMIRSRGNRLDDEQKDGLMTDIEQESERLFRMVEDLLALARVQLGQNPATEPLLMQRTVEKVVSAFAQRLPGRVVTMDIEQDLPAVAAQPVYVEQVLRNLLSNAHKYSPAGTPIEVRAHGVEGGVDVSVVDRGPGVAPGEAELIFERFYRSDEAPRLASGAGLGLTVCKRLIEAQEGRVWARPNEFGGLEAGFFLPFYQEETQ
ncbi:MAG TPA: PAS domain S-box protein [Dehalococcoidia bacterium]|nr:PAS domain S-box protein [Dehalococcoidia bacterium]